MSILPINHSFNSIDTRTISIRDILTTPRTDTIGAEPVAAQGSLIYETSTDTLYMSDGAAWLPVGGAASTEDLQATLTAGNATVDQDIEITSGTSITAPAEMSLVAGTQITIDQNLTGTGGMPAIGGSGAISSFSSNLAGSANWDSTITPSITVTFNGAGFPVGTLPRVVITPTSVTTASANLYISGVTNTSFTVTDATPGAVQSFYYIVIGSF